MTPEQLEVVREAAAVIVSRARHLGYMACVEIATELHAAFEAAHSKESALRNRERVNRDLMPSAAANDR
jgi:hypothetical protein